MKAFQHIDEVLRGLVVAPDSTCVQVPNGDWIPDNRAGLSICDATSAAFAMDIP
jgi:hypothetical protein